MRKIERKRSLPARVVRASLGVGRHRQQDRASGFGTTTVRARGGVLEGYPIRRCRDA
jgi:hypothetical protein